MNIDMPRLDRQHALIAAQHGIDDGGIGLGAANEEIDVGIGHFTCGAHLVTCRIAEIVKSVARGAHVIGLGQPF